jgi:hypothetical protein
MLALSYAIRSKDEWWRKRKDEGIRRKWKEEALTAKAENEDEAGEEEEERPVLTEHMVEYVLDELEEHEQRLGDPNGIRVRLPVFFPCLRSAHYHPFRATSTLASITDP